MGDGRRLRAVVLVAVVVVSAGLIGWGVTAAVVSKDVAEPERVRVTLEVAGVDTYKAAHITYVAGGAAPVRVDSVTLPWRLELEVDAAAVSSVVVLATSASTNEGSRIGCRISAAGGRILEEQSKTGAFGTVGCAAAEGFAHGIGR